MVTKGFVRVLCGIAVIGILMSLCSCQAPRSGKAGDEPLLSAATDPYMGDWDGVVTDEEGKESKICAQVISLGDGKYKANILRAFDTRQEPVVVLDGLLAGKANAALFIGQSGEGEGIIKCYGAADLNKFKGSFQGAMSGSFEMGKIVRLSPSFGKKPPAGALRLFDGKNVDQWQHPDGSAAKWQVSKGVMEIMPGSGSLITKKKFKDFKLHLEFRTPFMPEARGQGRGNSGVYLQERYEIQILDSYALEGLDNECGGIYKVSVPKVNMCAPPMQWQTYDIVFHAARFDESGNKVSNVRLTALHNNVKIHDDIEIPKPTGGAENKPENVPGGIYLQDHGNKVQFRNIWLVELN